MSTETLNKETTSNDYSPVVLGKQYSWQKGDTLMLIATKYRRTSQWLELLELNKGKFKNWCHLPRVGDIIDIPEDWFPLPDYSFEVKVIKR